jgi:hypothetical protein
MVIDHIAKPNYSNPEEFRQVPILTCSACQVGKSFLKRHCLMRAEMGQVVFIVLGSSLVGEILFANLIKWTTSRKEY